MEIGTVLKQTFLGDSLVIYCEIVDYTNKGYKVRETTIFPNLRKAPKTKTAFYSKLDFKQPSVWKVVSTPEVSNEIK